MSIDDKQALHRLRLVLRDAEKLAVTGAYGGDMAAALMVALEKSGNRIALITEEELARITTPNDFPWWLPAE